MKEPVVHSDHGYFLMNTASNLKSPKPTSNVEWNVFSLSAVSVPWTRNSGRIHVVPGNLNRFGGKFYLVNKERNYSSECFWNVSLDSSGEEWELK